MGFISHKTLHTPSAAQLVAESLVVGYHPTARDPFLTREVDRFSGTYILGVAGSGKSGLMEHQILADVKKGHSIVVLDPHGDLIDKVIAAMTLERLAKTYLLDMLDEEHPYGINLMGLSGRPKTSSEKSQAVDRVMHVLEALWADVLSQQHLPNYVRTATIALIHNPGMTLLQMRRFLTDQAFRAQALAQVSDPTVHEFWHEHDRLTPSAQTTRIQPLLNRLGAIFIGRDLIQNIVGQQTTISFRRAIEQREIILIKLPTTQLEQDARLLGTIIVAQISAALFSFGNVPEQDRPGVSLYVDEFQTWCVPDVARMFSEGRKFGMRVTLAHQLRGQLPGYIQDATASARTKVCFQLKADDAKEMAQYFPPPDTGRIAEVDAHVTNALLKDPGTDLYMRTFTDEYLRPLQSQRKGGKIKIERSGPTLAQIAWRGVDTATELAKAEVTTVEDPTQYLDDLLRDVMQNRNPNLTIPAKAVVGFANCGNGGRGFYNVVRGLTACEELLPGYVFSDEVYAPRNAREQFMHLIYNLRGVMRYLAAHPVGKRAEASTSAVAELLTQLPRRQALVRSGDDVGRIATYDTPTPVTGQELEERRAAIVAQTRAKYCRPRGDAHDMVVGNDGPLPPSDLVDGVRQAAAEKRSRWTELVEP